MAGPRGGLVIGNDPERYLERRNGFDYLMLTLIYPEAVCRADDDTIRDSCEVPANTPKWTLHGLWPNFANGSYPQFCTRQKFDINEVASILQELKSEWPNLYPKQTISSLWKHEWEKHGTCAQIDPILSSQLKYFNSTLQQLSRFHVDKALADQRIVPSMNQYSVNEINYALRKGLANGKNIQFNCLTDKKTHQTLLGDVRICLDLNLNVIDCPHVGERRLSFAPHLPNFQPCRGDITYLLSDSETMLQHLVDTSFRVMPVPMLVGLSLPIIGMLTAIVFLIILMISLCNYNCEILKKNDIDLFPCLKPLGKIKEKLLNRYVALRS
ncbi:unnamed protein product, partial [Mesorhabditis belari]|uniref:Ribonuclease T2 n=1 Tax=Mesorhabditis belari TaxID=2138241 RepID=A0AAF3J1N4_9BILA